MFKHKIFTTERNFLAYISPFMVASNKINQESALNEYRERLEAIVEDLKWMLSLPYQKFWCQALYDASFQRLVDTYLKFAPRYNLIKKNGSTNPKFKNIFFIYLFQRPYDLAKMKQFPSHITDLNKIIHRFVFLVCLRMSTYKENTVIFEFF